MKRNDIFVGIYILCAIMFLIIPLPTMVLDILMAMNISVAFIILFTALFSTEVLQMSAFPTMLLFTTIFRISLNVSSTRNILSRGYAEP